jgi:hypothetical protein
MSVSGAEQADGLPLPQRYWAILTIALGIMMSVVDGAIANVALPTIAGDLNASPSFSIWIVNGYQLAITISLLPLASLGEIVGYRRVYLGGRPSAFHVGICQTIESISHRGRGQAICEGNALRRKQNPGRHIAERPTAGPSHYFWFATPSLDRAGGRRPRDRGSPRRWGASASQC